IQILDYKWARHDWTVRLDQRIAVTGQTSNDHLATSFAVSPDGQLTEVGFYSAAEYGSLASNGVTFLPSGRSYATGGGYITSVPMERDGSFAGLAMVGPLGVISAHRPGVTPDGRFAVATWNSDSSGIHWGVYALNPYGGIELIRDHTFPFGYSDIAFIPPRTGEMLGDANADGQRDAADIVTYLNHLNDRGDFEEWHPLSPLIRGPVPKARADANQDGEITWGDLEWLLQFLLESDGN
ncbi:dockerin type I repeat-containing protein, partial [Candidatus Sumerlaeota bacterium]|nr:dockerin type I repeat-containing protein [Candidatus Sumerlaeota bacterium]